MPYSIQIEKLGTTPPDGLTPLDLSDPEVTRTQENDRIIITIADGTDFGTFDPGEIVGLNHVPYMLISATVKSSLNASTDGSVSIVGPAAPGAAFSTRKIVELLDLTPPGVQLFALGLDLGLQCGHQDLEIAVLAIQRLVVWLQLDFPAIPLRCWLPVGEQLPFAYAPADGIDADT